LPVLAGHPPLPGTGPERTGQTIPNGAVLLEAQDPEAALQAYERAIAADPGHPVLL